MYLDHFGSPPPTAQLSENIQECRNKHLKYYTCNHTQKIGRPATRENILNILLVSSNPLIASLTPPPQRKHKLFIADVLALISSPEFKELNFSNSNESETHSDLISNF